MLNGRGAVITGSLGGIGYAIASALAGQGCSVMLNGFGPDELIQSRVAELRSLGVDADYHGADISDARQVEDLVAAANRRFGQIDILVNNAVTRFDANIEDLPPEKWSYALAVNLTAAYHLIRLTLPGMKQRNWGRIISLASIFGVEGTPRRTDYVVTKHGLVGMTKVVALECAGFDITCNALCPGLVDTPHIRQRIAGRMAEMGLTEEQARAAFLEPRQPSKRFVTPERIGALAAFLCSDDACDITGTPIPIDGGWQARA
ncbi:3-hydroxybutyrate dehydrogenase [Candidimonas nitroreducens]|uniref:3-hydroxybutyrate dehydrogenase n=1 Tax=Candidimonas nitroreducens TaxID=683354 RepID=A0A225MRT4_9BURK|nr:3-hydroxybutyrate dehydrogenase [Candidimonas nitroreducens]OWT63928.1 3-hydroxybutyrate dehydrogenase [Candidimonas nitroreducens]